MSNLNKFKTSVINLEKVHNEQFYIPTYQRPYVWGQVEIEKLLTDFYKTFRNDNKQPYFIGTILTKKNIDSADLVDGQQRFTTLWLTAFVFNKKGISTRLVDFLSDNQGRLRLGFEIRTEVAAYLNQLIGRDTGALQISSTEIENQPYLKHIAGALATIEGIISQFAEDELPAFGDYIYQQVFLVDNITPDGIDMNHLFATINSAGVQLEQTDIVKANLLRVIGNTVDGEKVLYSKIWEACENMKNFFERNARAVFSESDWNAIDLTHFNRFDEQIFKFKPVENETQTSFAVGGDIESILNETKAYIQEGSKSKNEMDRKAQEVYCRSIINFGQLLLHAYRLHLHREGKPDFEGTFHVNRLIEVFSSLESRHDREEVKRFFLLLWDVRQLFDHYIIKWLSDVDDKSEQLELVNINRNAESYYSRSRYEKCEMLMLQSVLYFTGDYLRQFWLTPFLDFLLKSKERNFSPNGIEVLQQLEDLDNQLSTCSAITDKEATFQLLERELCSDVDFVSYLSSKSLGTHFKHYWFYKLEYVLWKGWEFRDAPQFNNYRITSKNSIEHVFPQHHEFGLKLESSKEDILNSFGNLGLLSVSENSAYSNQDVEKKRVDFERKPAYDSLKLAYIYQDEGVKNWEPDKIKAHQGEMIDKIKKHYKNGAQSN